MCGHGELHTADSISFSTWSPILLSHLGVMGPPGHNLCFPMKVWTPLGTPPRTPLAQEEWIFGSFGKLVLNFAATIFQGERRQERNWCCFLCRAGEAELPLALLTLGTRNSAPRMDQRGSSGLNIDLSTFPAPSSSPCWPNLSMQTAPVWLVLLLSPIPHPSASELGVPPPHPTQKPHTGDTAPLVRKQKKCQGSLFTTIVYKKKDSSCHS